ncbi:hypothetical protein ACOSQ4_031886 [Xanthoceras sorbifolium]
MCVEWCKLIKREIKSSPSCVFRNLSQRCTTSDLKPYHPTNSGIRAQENQKYEEQRPKPNLPRNKSSPNSFLSIPVCSTRPHEFNGENLTQIGVPESPHALFEVGE